MLRLLKKQPVENSRSNFIKLTGRPYMTYYTCFIQTFIRYTVTEILAEIAHKGPNWTFLTFEWFHTFINYSTKETHIWLPWHIISILGNTTNIIWYQTVPWSIWNRMMATINVSLNYPRYQSRTSTGGVSCQKWQFLYFYGHHQKQFLCTYWWRNHGLGRNNSTWQDLVIVDGNLNSRRYIDEILRPVVVPYVQNMGQGALFQDDNVRPHRARIVDAYL